RYFRLFWAYPRTTPLYYAFSTVKLLHLILGYRFQ
ncbi:MAG: hypothetical protein ACI8UX_002332, partial [Psychromonas sp.]